MANEILTHKDCDTVIKKYLNTENFEIVDYEVKQFFEEVNGFLGEHLLLLIKVKTQETVEIHPFFTKRFPFDHGMQSEYLRSMNGWQREIYFFEIFLENLRTTLPGYQLDFVPKYLLGKPDDIIVFEDLTLKNYDLPRKPSLNLLDNEHICLVLKALAKFHAGSLAYEELKSKELGERFRLFRGEEDLVKEPLIRSEEGFLGYMWFKAGVKGLEALIDIVCDGSAETIDVVKGKFRILVSKALDLMTPHEHFRNVLAHGDLWAKNVMYQYDKDSKIPTNALLVDFQLQRYQVPAHDVLLFISLTTNKLARQQYFTYYMKYYHNSLVNELQKVNIDAKDISMSFDDFLKSVSFIMPEIKVQGALQRLQQCGNKEFYTKLLNDKAEFKKFVFGDKTPFALELFETDGNFRSLLTEAVEELIETSLYPEVFREDCYRILEQDLGGVYYEFEEFRAIKSELGDSSYVLEIRIVLKGEKTELKYLVKSEPLNFVRVVEKL